MSIIRWDPFRESISLRDAIDRLFEESFIWPRGWPTSRQVGLGTFPIDLYEEGNSLLATASLPGVKPDELNVEIQDNRLTISGEMKQEKERKEENYHLREHRYGRFERTVTLPCAVRADKVEAVFENGVLTLTMPMAEESRSRKVQVQVKK